MATTSFFAQLKDQLQSARCSMSCQHFQAASSCDATAAPAPASIPALPAVADSRSDPAPATSSSFDIVIYGIGRFAEYATPHGSIADTALSPAQIRASIRSTSRPAQLQLACILAVAQDLCHLKLQSSFGFQIACSAAAGPSVTASAEMVANGSAFSASDTVSSPRFFLYDPMLSSLEHAVARSLGLIVIDENEEGQQQLTAARRSSCILCDCYWFGLRND
jgi:hypothetical protein